MTGYTAEEMVGKNPRLFQSGKQSKEFYAAMWKSINECGQWQGEIWNRRKNGEIYPEHLSITAVKNQQGVVSHYVASIVDITERRAATDAIEKLAFYDPLTDLPNRRLLLDRLNLALASSHRTGLHGALLFIDLDHFKRLNDTYGHDMGDLLLQQVAERLIFCVRENDTVARLGGDEFIVMLEDLSAQGEQALSQTKVIGNKILDTLNQVHQLTDHIYHNTPSIGAILFNGHQQSTEELLKQIDIAMYSAKVSGRNALHFFDPNMQITLSDRVALEADLRVAIAKNQFKLYYQAQTTHKGEIVGAEVLIRWRHPQRGLVMPAEFIPLAEEAGLILSIGQWILEATCRQLKIWENDAQMQHLQLAVNVSAKQFHQTDFVEKVCQIIRHTAIKPERLKLELTESLVLDNIVQVIHKMNELKKIGVQFAMDDFGTGYSSLAYLTQLPFCQLKIDRSFVQNIGVKTTDAIIIQTIIGMTENLGMEVIAEGVETEAQRVFLEQHGCPFYQGFLCSKPMPIGQFEAELRK
jgi:diguanylate cyclase (GGDEF)-like protein/PAS domain S-box-containing protein